MTLTTYYVPSPVSLPSSHALNVRHLHPRANCMAWRPRPECKGSGRAGCSLGRADYPGGTLYSPPFSSLLLPSPPSSVRLPCLLNLLNLGTTATSTDASATIGSAVLLSNVRCCDTRRVCTYQTWYIAIAEGLHGHRVRHGQAHLLGRALPPLRDRARDRNLGQPRW